MEAVWLRSVVTRPVHGCWCQYLRCSCLRASARNQSDRIPGLVQLSSPWEQMAAWRSDPEACSWAAGLRGTDAELMGALSAVCRRLQGLDGL